jgi:hypothetical protein
MNEIRTTLALWGAALLVAIVAWATAPRSTTLDVFSDRGEPFFPQLTDPNSAASLEVIEFDEQNGAPRALKILNRDGRWIIPSQFDYPADARDRLGQTAAAVITLRKDEFASENPADHERLGVVDPLDLSVSSLKGRGTRISIRGRNETLLADLIVGNQPQGREGYRYVRLPDNKRVYSSRIGALDVSTDFEDWIERDVLQVNRDEIDEVVIRNYSVDEKTGAVNVRETVRLQKRGDDEWVLSGAAGGQTLNRVAINELVTRLVGLRIVGVLPKPAGITAMLSRSVEGQRVSQEDIADLARKGFYVSQDGTLLSNEGDVVVHTRAGIFYTLRFGQVAPGSAEPSRSAGAAATPAQAADGGPPRENRYLFIMAAYDPTSATGGGAPAEEAKRRIGLLHARFAPWYYIISADDFSKLRPTRADLTAKASAPTRNDARP